MMGKKGRRLCFGILVFVRIMMGQGSVFDAIQPGQSTNAEVRARFGKPLRSESVGNIKIEHFGDEENLFKEVSAWFDSQDILQWVRVELMHTISPEDAALLFGLVDEPGKAQGHAFAENQAEEGETRYFLSKGVYFYIPKEDVTEIWLTQPQTDAEQIQAQIRDLEHGLKMQAEQTSHQKKEVESQLHADQRTHQVNETESHHKQQKSFQMEEQRTFFGAVFTRHEGEGIKLLGVLDNTPAQNTGLQKGDIILEVEDISFRDKGSHPEQFSGMVQKLPEDRPLCFLIQRDEKRFEVWIKPLRIDKEQYAAFQNEIREKFSDPYSRGRRLMASENYAEAIEYLKRALKSNTQSMQTYQGLGICCYHLGRYKEARKYLENAIKLDKTQPLSWFYGAANMDALGKRNGAMDGYKRYLKLNHDNPEMNAFARKRLDDLRKKRKSDWKSQLLKVIDAVKKEIEK